jgi:hypothetical protein
MLILVCYRITIGKTTVHGDTYLRIPRMDPYNIEEARKNIRGQVMQKYKQRSRKTLPDKEEKGGKLHFTSLIEIEDGPIPAKEKADKSKESGLPELTVPSPEKGETPTTETNEQVQSRFDDTENQFRSRRVAEDRRKAGKQPSQDSPEI